jgi:hypothetical protein
VNRSFVVRCFALGAAALSAAAYSRFTDAAPAAPPLAHTSRVAEPARSSGALHDTAPVSLVSASPEIARLDARRQLYESVDALVQASEFEKARQLLDEDQARYGDDLAPEWRDLEQSYRLIADCLERPTPKARVRAEAFVLVSQALSLKQRILAACGSRPVSH